VDGHVFVERGHLLRKSFACFAAETIDPIAQRFPRRVIKPFYLFVAELAGLLHGRKPDRNSLRREPGEKQGDNRSGKHARGRVARQHGYGDGDRERDQAARRRGHIEVRAR